ncbi:unnamed protein product, partial [Oppiella nova]
YKSLALDYIHNIIYYPLCNYTSKDIGIYAVNITDPHKHQFPIVRQQHCVAKDIRVDPLKSLLFWSEYIPSETTSSSYSSYSRYTSRPTYSDTRHKSHIMRSSQDGQGVQIIMYSQYVRRNTLSIDITAKRLYWISSESLYSSVSRLYSIGYDGSDQRLILSSMSLFSETTITAMDVFGDYIYWTDNANDTILRVNVKESSEESVVHVVLQSGVDINAMKVVHKSRQPMARNKYESHLCPELCLPSSYNHRNYTCRSQCESQTWNGNTCVTVSPVSVTPIYRVTTPSTPYEVLDNETKLLFVSYKEGIYVKQNIHELDTNYIESIGLVSSNELITELDYNYNKNFMLYIVNGVAKGIEVFTIGHNLYSYDVVIHNEYLNSYDVAVDPNNGLLVWSKKKYTLGLFLVRYMGSIMRANQDGSNIQVLYNSTGNIKTLTLDIHSQLVYWIDTNTNYLKSITYFGTNYRLISSNSRFGSTFSMDMFGENIFWSNSDTNSIYITEITDKTEGVQRLITSYADLRAIRVLDPNRQINGTNRCLNHKCSQLCLPVQQDYRCVCAKDRILCKENETLILQTNDTNLIQNTTDDSMGRISQKLDSLLNTTSNATNYWIIIAVIIISINLL